MVKLTNSDDTSGIPDNRPGRSNRGHRVSHQLWPAEVEAQSRQVTSNPWDYSDFCVQSKGLRLPNQVMLLQNLVRGTTHWNEWMKTQFIYWPTFFFLVLQNISGAPFSWTTEESGIPIWFKKNYILFLKAEFLNAAKLKALTCIHFWRRCMRV